MAAATVGVTVELRGGHNERLQQVVRRGLPGLRQALEAGERWLPRHVERELQRFLGCGDPSEGFGWLVCGACEHHRLVAFSCKGRGFCPSCGGRRMAERAKRWVEALLPRVAVRQWVLTVPWPRRWLLGRRPELLKGVARRLTEELSRWYREKSGEPLGRTGAIVVVQRFGSALNLNVHLHLLVLDGVYVEHADGSLRWCRVRAPTNAEVEALVERVARRVETWLARRGHGHEDTDDDALHSEDATAVLQAASVQGRLAVGRRAGRRVRRIQVLGGRTFALPPRCAAIDGYNLHGGVGVGAKDRRGLERLCRYLLRPAVPLGRLEDRPDGTVALTLRRPWSDGTTALCFTPTELVEKLVALVPPPHANQVLYQGVLAARSAWRSRVVPKPPRRPKGLRLVRPPLPAASRWTPWADLLRHVFDSDPLRCPRCHGPLVLRTVVLPPAAAHILEGLARAARAPPATLEQTA